MKSLVEKLTLNNNSRRMEELPDYENMDAEDLFFEEWRSNGIIRQAIQYALENLDKWDPKEMWFGVDDPEHPENKCIYTKKEAERVLSRADECLEF